MKNVLNDNVDDKIRVQLVLLWPGDICHDISVKVVISSILANTTRTELVVSIEATHQKHQLGSKSKRRSPETRAW